MKKKQKYYWEKEADQIIRLVLASWINMKIKPSKLINIDQVNWLNWPSDFLDYEVEHLWKNE